MYTKHVGQNESLWLLWFQLQVIFYWLFYFLQNVSSSMCLLQSTRPCLAWFCGQWTATRLCILQWWLHKVAGGKYSYHPASYHLILPCILLTYLTAVWYTLLVCSGSILTSSVLLSLRHDMISFVRVETTVYVAVSNKKQSFLGHRSKQPL